MILYQQLHLLVIRNAIVAEIQVLQSVQSSCRQWFYIINLVVRQRELCVIIISVCYVVSYVITSVCYVVNHYCDVGKKEPSIIRSMLLL